MNQKSVVIYGAGGFARELAWLIKSTYGDDKKVMGFIDDDENNQGKILNDIPVFSLKDAKVTYPDARIIGGIGSPKTRENVINKALKAGFSFLSVIHPNVEISNYVEIGNGVVICAGSIITTNVVLRDHVQINLDCTIGHDVIMDDYSTLAPGVHVSGHVHIGERAYVGTGANIINGTEDKPLIIQNDVIIGAGACVINNVPAGQTVVGVPAESINNG